MSSDMSLRSVPRFAPSLVAGAESWKSKNYRDPRKPSALGGPPLSGAGRSCFVVVILCSVHYNEGMTQNKKTSPTTDTYVAFQQAFEYFNKQLFEGELPDCMITLRTFGKARGYFKSNSFAHLATVTTVHEIALDPRQFIERSSVEILSTLVHEMCHLWQMENGKPSRGSYHNKEWATKMHGVGLFPSSTAEPGGKQTGPAVSHYIVEDGIFERKANALVKKGKFQTAWVDVEGFLLAPPDKASPNAKLAPPPKTRRNGTRDKYICPECDNAAWGKFGMAIKCSGSEGVAHRPTAML